MFYPKGTAIFDGRGDRICKFATDFVFGEVVSSKMFCDWSNKYLKNYHIPEYIPFPLAQVLTDAERIGTSKFISEHFVFPEGFVHAA